MDKAKLERAARPAALGGYLKKSAAAREAGHAGHEGTVRTTEHNGHKIALTTTYRVEVDGKAQQLPLMVDDDGNVHCHSLPNYQFNSAIDMIKAVVDAFPDDFPPPKAGGSKPAKPGHAHGAEPGGKKGGGARRKKP